MSKLYKKYLELKKEDSEKCYLFHSGIFYIFLADDAKKMSKLLSLKETKFTDEVSKCGFPENSKDKYLLLLAHMNVCYEMIEREEISIVIDQKVLKKLKEIKGLRLDEVTPIRALKILYELREVL